MAFAYWIFFSNVTGALIVLFFGFFGQVVDSWLGAKWEEKRKLNNTHVNFLSTAVAAVLARRGEPIGTLDTLMAAHALSLPATFVTNNTRHFARVVAGAHDAQ